MKNYKNNRKGIIMWLSAVMLFMSFSKLEAGCNFGITSKTHSGNVYTFVIGQGAWGPRQYNWYFGDGTSGVSYSNANNTTTITHAFSVNGVYTMTITSQDSLGGGCTSAIMDSVNVWSNSAGGNGCNPQFTYWVDSANCQVHIVNQSTGGTNPTYDWSYFDGGQHYITNQANPVLSFTATSNASYNVTLYQFDNGQYCDSLTVQVSMPLACGGNPSGGSSCHASFQYTRFPSHCWQFNNFSSAGGVTPSYTWYFGDGNTSSQVNPQHCYTDGLASHNVMLILNTAACSDSITMTIVDSLNNNGGGNNGACHAQFYYWIDSTNCSVHFMNQSTGSNLFNWLFFDGSTTFTSSATNPVISFSVAPGTAPYVTLYAYDSAGQLCDTVSNTVYYGPNCINSGNPTSPGCNAQFILINDSVNTHTYYAYNTSTGLGLTYAWNFGDGTTSTLQYPSHTYATPGNYIICLTVTGSNSCTATYCDSNNVQKIAITHLMQNLIVRPSQTTATTSINNYNKEMQISMYPNPANLDLTVSAAEEIAAVRIMDISGKTILTQNGIFSQKHVVTISSLEAGSYFMEITTKNGSKAMKRFVKISD